MLVKFSQKTIDANLKLLPLKMIGEIGVSVPL